MTIVGSSVLAIRALNAEVPDAAGLDQRFN
jgi:hypothetical protein